MCGVVCGVGLESSEYIGTSEESCERSKMGGWNKQEHELCVPMMARHFLRKDEAGKTLAPG